MTVVWDAALPSWKCSQAGMSASPVITGHVRFICGTHTFNIKHRSHFKLLFLWNAISSVSVQSVLLLVIFCLLDLPTAQPSISPFPQIFPLQQPWKPFRHFSNISYFLICCGQGSRHPCSLFTCQNCFLWLVGEALPECNSKERRYRTWRALLCLVKSLSSSNFINLCWSGVVFSALWLADNQGGSSQEVLLLETRLR